MTIAQRASHVEALHVGQKIDAALAPVIAGLVLGILVLGRLC